MFKLINMKKIIFKSIITSFCFFLVFGYTKAQSSNSSAKSSAANSKNQTKITSNKNNEQDWRQLLNGTDLTGWKHVGKGDMLIEDGMIRGKSGMGLLYWTKEKFGNCTLRIVYKMQKENSNSGVFIRIPVEPY